MSTGYYSGVYDPNMSAAGVSAFGDSKVDRVFANSPFRTRSETVQYGPDGQPAALVVRESSLVCCTIL